MYDLITLGSATIDIFAYAHPKFLRINHKEMMSYPVGGKLLLQDVHVLTGGGGTNAATTFARFGLKTAYFGNLGKGHNAGYVLDDLKKERIKFIGTRSNHKTNVSIILDSVGHDRTVLTYKGASSHLKYRQLPKARWIYSSSLMDESFKTMQKVFSYAARHGIHTAFNPSSYQAEKGVRYLRNILKNTTVLVLNDEEATLLTKDRNVLRSLKKLHAMGPEIVIITEGKKGAHAYHNGIIYSVPPRPIKVIECTGAGDAFASGFVAGSVLGYSFELCLKLGMANAESVIQDYGAKAGILRRGTALQRARQDRRKIKKTSITSLHL